MGKISIAFDSLASLQQTVICQWAAKSGPLSHVLFPGLIAVALFSAMPGTSQGQLFTLTNLGVNEYSLTGQPVNAPFIGGFTFAVGIAASGNDLFVGDSGLVEGTIHEYTTSGATVIAPFSTGQLGSPQNIAVSGNDLFVTNGFYIGEFTTTGATVNALLVKNLPGAEDIAAYGNDLFVTNGESISEYTTLGTLVNANFITGLAGNSYGLTISGGDLFVTIPSMGTVGEYTTSGATVNASLITGLTNPEFVAVYGGDVFVQKQDGTVGEYTTSGTTVNASLIITGNTPTGIVVLPEPSSIALLIVGAIGVAALARRRSR